jgi:AraC-like DNA-binding protein/quercetin dioxygenase-like cupin family protein
LLGGDDLKNELHTEKFHMQYKNDVIENSLLWENHCHDQLEMIVVFEGEINVTLEGRDFGLSSGEMIVVPPLCYHTISAKKRGSYRRLTVLFDPFVVPKTLSDIFIEGEPCVREVGEHISGKLQNIFSKDISEFYAPLADGLTTELLYEPPIKKPCTDPYTDENLSKMLTYIDGHIAKKLTLEDIASHASLSVSSVCHIFADKMKISPGKYILKKKMALASSLMRSGVPASVVAAQVGYSDYSGFYKIYKKHTGSAPSGE